MSLLDGVTGSGKTEVYFEAIAAALEPRQAGAGADAGDRAHQPVHCPLRGALRRQARSSGIPGCRRRARPRLARGRRKQGEARGRRPLGAVPPFPDLGLIVVDEERDQGYKQEERVAYQARDMAVLRGSLGHLPGGGELGDALHREPGERGPRPLPAHPPRRTLPGRASRYRFHRHAGKPPERGKWLSPVLVDAIGETLRRGEQALLFLNRRGYAPVTLCRKCGFRFECPNCSAWLVEHRFRHRLECHHCGRFAPLPEVCPTVARSIRSSRAAPASSASPRRSPSAFPRRAACCCRAT